MSGLLRANFPNPGDGTGDGYEEAYEAWLTIGQLEKDGWLVPVTIDYEAAHDHAQEFVANLSVDDIHAIVDAAVRRQE